MATRTPPTKNVGGTKVAVRAPAAPAKRGRGRPLGSKSKRPLEQNPNSRKNLEQRRTSIPQTVIPSQKEGTDSYVAGVYHARQQVNSIRQLAKNQTVRDIAFLPEFFNYKPLSFQGINWERRLACKADPVLDLKTYMPRIFYLDFADFQLELVHSLENRITTGGKKAIAFPRGTGKTAICRGMLLRATKYGLKKFAFFIGSKEDKAVQTLDFLKQYWHRSPELQQDFPEIAYPIHRIEGRGGVGSMGQLYKGERTYLEWTATEMRYPTMLLTEEDVKPYLDHDPSCVVYLASHDRFIINSAGTVIRVTGIDGSIRGEAETHPILLTQPRPDLVLLDDVQKDQTASSPASCETMEILIEAAVTNLAGPDVPLTCLMPCTVIREGDVADTYLTPEKKPEWFGQRYGLVRQFPNCIDYDHIYEEINGIPSEQGKKWIEYAEIRKKSLRIHGDMRLANDYYREHQAELERDFLPSWPERYKRNTPPSPEKDEVSAIQSLMNLRLGNHLAYLAEHENRPRGAGSTNVTTVTSAQVRERMTNIPRGQLSLQWTNVVAFIDVQDEILFFAVLAHDLDYNGQFLDYGTYPRINVPYFRKNQLAGWSFLTREFYKTHPNDKPTGVHSGRNTHLRAPFDAKIYYALRQACNHLLSQEYPRTDQTMMRIRALAIDTKWGESSAVVKQFVREYNNERVMCYEGHPFMPSFKQLEEYNPTPGWIFEHQMHPHTQESKWCIKPYQKGEHNQRFIQSDVNRWKTFLMKRLSSPSGSPGGVTLFHEPSSDSHRMFADHVTSEIPEEIQNRGITKTTWTPKPGYAGDNDYLDCAVGCLCLASICGASLKFDATGTAIKTTKRSLRQVYNRKKQPIRDD